MAILPDVFDTSCRDIEADDYSMAAQLICHYFVQLLFRLPERGAESDITIGYGNSVAAIRVRWASN